MEQQQQQEELQEEEQEKRKEEESSGLYKPCLQDGELLHAFDSSVQSVDPMSIDQCQTIRDMDDSQLVGAPSGADVVASASAREDVPMVEVKPAAAAAMVVTVEETSVGKRKRGRPPKALGNTNTTKQSKTMTSQSPQLQSQRKKKDEEDVCFICFDGGSLVLCDRRGCPKAYHPSCIKRDESFFKSRAKWNCGWHICSSCQKAAHYMCYTCTTSLCKGCIKDADYQCVRGNMGLCGTCMRTVMLIENLQGNKEMAEVDFDDKSSWEYLFKMYWIFLKRKIHLTSDELIQAKNPWKEADSMASKKESSLEHFDGNDNKGSSVNNYCAFKETNNSKRRKTKILNKDSLSMETSGNTYLSDKGTPLPEGTRWASKELLEFVAHMKNGDVSVLSKYDVQALLLEYIKKNNLRDPHRKCQIVCDLRLINLFGEVRVGHFEMLKLLESHFLIKENYSADDIFKVGVVDAVASQVEADDVNFDNQLLMGSDKKRKTRKKADERARRTNLDAFAAIDVHNINLIYLRRNLMENLMDDAHNFHDKVVGSIVRIRISSNDQKQDMYRLVQVVGTSKVAESYKIGERTTDVMLEILNLNKKEAMPIDGISNQDFFEDECKRLRQSIKCGLIKRFTVGEIQAKAITLQAVRVNDGLETEILRLNHLRDRASEKGHRKELREFVEKLQLLNSPEERQRRLHEIPEVHTDPNMDPSYESEDNAGELDEKKQDDNVRSKNSGDGRKGREPISTRRGGKSFEQSRNLGKTSNAHKDGTAQLHERLSQSSWNQEREASGVNGWSTPAINSSGSVAIGCNNQGVVRSELWHYQDPSGIIQGPFSMSQLRKWTGHFPSDLRIWRISENQDDSILLTDALSGQCQEKSLFQGNGNLLSPKVGVVSDDRHNIQDGEWSGCMNAADGKEVEGSWNPKQDDSSVHCNGNDELAKSNGWGSNSSSWTPPVDVVNSNEGRNGDVVQGCDSLKGNNSWPDQPQLCSSSPLPPPFSGKSYETLPHQVKEGHGGESNSDQDNGNCNSPMTAEGQIKKEQGYENRSDSEGHSGQSSGQSWRPPPINSSSNGLDSKSGFISVVKSLEATEQNQEIGFPDLPSPTPKQSNGDSKGQAAENKQAASSNVPVHDAGPSWSTASSLVGGVAQLTEVAGKWREEWDSNLVSASSLNPTEMVSDHAATPISINDQLTHSSPSHPASNASNWPAIDTGPPEFCSLADESVSDLLAEVEAMESLRGLASPTSKMNCGEAAFTEDSKNDCLSPVAGFSPALDPGKGDALSSTGDLQVPSQSTVTDGPHGVWQADVLDPQKRSSGHSSSSIEVEGEAKLSEVSVNQWEASDIPPTVPSTASVEVAATDTTWRVGAESTDTSWGAVQGNANLGWGGLDQRNTNMNWGTGQVINQESSSMNLGTSAVGNPNIWGTQPRYSGERWFGPRERGFQGRDSGFGRGRNTWNRQSAFGGGNGGGSFRPPPKGQRVCKFYENGYCKKGASCGYLHP